ncbi:MAG: NAD-dependent epimerase/dehydratase family protein [Acidimicrobiales bacterium]
MGIQLVTGVAGFVGSHLAEQLLDMGHEVRGVDCFTPYYDGAMKRSNMARLLSSKRFDFVELDLRRGDLGPLLRDVSAVFHQAAQPGVRLSWAEQFTEYASCNIEATQRLLEAARTHPIDRFVYASSSSVYGNAAHYPTTETDVPLPFSPYGVTKLAAEHLCGLYASNYGTPTVSLRYFTVYGPRQRPDMAMHRLIEAALDDLPFPLYGDGSHVRDFTFVDDIVAANVAAATAPVTPGTVLNICAGGSTTMREVIDGVMGAVGRPLRVDRRPEQPGDVHRTGGDNARARESLQWQPQVQLPEGIAAQVEWHRSARARS